MKLLPRLSNLLIEVYGFKYSGPMLYNLTDQYVDFYESGLATVLIHANLAVDDAYLVSACHSGTGYREDTFIQDGQDVEVKLLSFLSNFNDNFNKSDS